MMNLRRVSRRSWRSRARKTNDSSSRDGAPSKGAYAFLSWRPCVRDSTRMILVVAANKCYMGVWWRVKEREGEHLLTRNLYSFLWLGGRLRPLSLTSHAMYASTVVVPIYIYMPMCSGSPFCLLLLFCCNVNKCVDTYCSSKFSGALHEFIRWFYGGAQGWEEVRGDSHRTSWLCLTLLVPRRLRTRL